MSEEINSDRRHFVGTPAMTIAAAPRLQAGPCVAALERSVLDTPGGPGVLIFAPAFPRAGDFDCTVALCPERKPFATSALIDYLERAQ